MLSAAPRMMQKSGPAAGMPAAGPFIDVSGLTGKNSEGYRAAGLLRQQADERCFHLSARAAAPCRRVHGPRSRDDRSRKKTTGRFRGRSGRVIVVRSRPGVAVEHLHAVQQGGVLPRQPVRNGCACTKQQAFAVRQGAQLLRDGIPVQLRRTVKQFGRSAEQEIVVVACGGAKLKPAVNVQAGLCPCFTRGAVAGQKAVDLFIVSFTSKAVK